MSIEIDCLILTIHVQAHLTRRRMKFLNRIDGMLEELHTQLLTLEGGENVNLLQMINVLIFGLDGKVSGRFIALEG